MSSKSKRRVTVDTGNTVTEDAEKRKPSVFERLGPGAGQRKYSEYDSEVCLRARFGSICNVRSNRDCRKM